MDDNKPPFRAAIFGLNGLIEHPVVIKGPKDEVGCGLYIHVDDIGKYLEWQKKQDE